MALERVTEQRLRAPVVAEYPAARAGLRDLLERAGIEVVRDLAPDDLESIEPLDALDALVLDAGEATADLLERVDVPAVALVDSPGEVVRDASGGAARGSPRGPVRGFVRRDVSAEALAAAVRAVAAGMLVLDPALASAGLPVGAAIDPDAAAAASLTEREREVLERVALGLPNKGIALELGISEHTVKFHVGSILGKLGAASRTEAVMEAARRGLLAL